MSNLLAQLKFHISKEKGFTQVRAGVSCQASIGIDPYYENSHECMAEAKERVRMQLADGIYGEVHALDKELMDIECTMQGYFGDPSEWNQKYRERMAIISELRNFGMSLPKDSIEYGIGKVPDDQHPVARSCQDQH